MSQKSDQDYLWLEEIESAASMDWVNTQNSATEAELKGLPSFEEFKAESLELLHDKEKIPYGIIKSGHIYNLWKDEKYKQGLLRRVLVGNYRKGCEWEEVLDLDQLSARENENWVFAGLDILDGPNGLSMLFLSRGGKDATVAREFDLGSKEFVEDGFFIPEAKNAGTWYDRDHFLVGTDFDDESRTDSGYVRKIKLWNRNSPLSDLSKKPSLLEIPHNEMGLWSYRLIWRDQVVHLIYQSIDFYRQKYYVFDGKEAKLLRIPEDARLEAYYDGQIIYHLNSDWECNGKVYPTDSLLSSSKEELLKPEGPSEVEVIFSPSKERVFQNVYASSNRLFISFLENVIGKITQVEYKEGIGWSGQEIPLPENVNARILGCSGNGEEVLIEYEGMTSPSKVFCYRDELEEIFSLKDKFNAEGIEVRQLWATSADGEKIPYFICGKDLDKGPSPTLLYGYGGFQISLTPTYSPQIGRLWLEKGGIYVLANIRGGGEFGPRWHQSALKLNRRKCYEDFAAIAEDLVSKGLTTSEQLGISGGSNGGLLMGAMLTLRPELFKAVLCDVPLLDMIRYTKLLAGASWAAEYGDPEESKEMKDYILSYSPFQNVKEEGHYPRTFFYTSTKDDRVHPGHARKMAAKMMDQGHDVLYLENIDGGHGRNVDLEKTAEWFAMRYSFLWKELADRS